jgi:hypothetical protein
MADLTASSRIKDSQDVDEEINDIHVQVDGGKDVFLWRQIMHQHLDTKKKCYFCRILTIHSSIINSFCITIW